MGNVSTCCASEKEEFKQAKARQPRRKTVNNISEQLGFLKTIENDYQFHNKLGSGAYGEVFLGINKITKAEVAIKAINKEKTATFAHIIKSEIEILAQMDSPYIVKQLAIYEDDKNYYIILEYCNGGELLYSIEHRKRTKHPYKEWELAKIMKQILKSIDYLHHRSVCHRDLKLENYMFQNKDSKSRLKLIDFGLAVKLDSNSYLTQDKIGTPYYMAPEVLIGKYGLECDMWSAGIILYALIAGAMPFYGSSNQMVYRKVLEDQPQFNGKVWDDISADAKDLVSLLLIKNPQFRLRADQALQHPWFKLCKFLKNSSSQVSELSANSKIYRLKPSLQNDSIISLTKQIYATTEENLRSLFNKLDDSQKGQVEFDRLFEALEKEYSLSKMDLKQSLKIEDTIPGNVEYSQFLSAISQTNVFKESAIWKAFKQIDTNFDGKISVQEMIDGYNSTDKYTETLKFDRADVRASVNYIDFRSMLHAAIGEESFETSDETMTPNTSTS
jgi:calcium-dependent protein kinase